MTMLRRIPLLIALLPCVALAAGQGELLSRLDQKFNDVNDARLTEAHKVTLINAVAHDLSREYVYTKLDTVTTVADQENYDLNTDCAGALAMAYVKTGTERTWLQIVDNADLITLDKPANRAILYAFLVGEQALSFEAIPKKASDIIILEYYAYIPALSTDTSEWVMPDAYEEAALQIVAAKCYETLETPWAIGKAQALEAAGRKRIQEIKNSMTVTVQAGDTSR